MPTRIPASELYRISEEDLRSALETFDHGDVAHDFDESTRFDLLVQGTRRYPPKAIVGLAARRALGRTLSHRDLTGGENTPAFRLLLNHGFEIVTKRHALGRLSSVSFSVGRSTSSTFVLIELSDEAPSALQLIVAGLAQLDATIVDAVIETPTDVPAPGALVQALAAAKRSFPVRVRDSSELQALPFAIATAMARLRRDPSIQSGLELIVRLTFSTQEDFTLVGLSTALVDGLPSPQGSFRFVPKAPTSALHVGSRCAVDDLVVTRVHAQMQRALYRELLSIHGISAVGAEHLAASSRPADILVRVGDSLFDLYEIKTAFQPKDCVRQALGQLLEYAYWPGGPEFRRLYVVGPSSIDAETTAYRLMMSLQRSSRRAGRTRRGAMGRRRRPTRSPEQGRPGPARRLHLSPGWAPRRASPRVPACRRRHRVRAGPALRASPCGDRRAMRGHVTRVGGVGPEGLLNRQPSRFRRGRGSRSFWQATRQPLRSS